jgi:hypothetical protein
MNSDTLVILIIAAGIIFWLAARKRLDKVAKSITG